MTVKLKLHKERQICQQLYLTNLWENMILMT